MFLRVWELENRAAARVRGDEMSPHREGGALFQQNLRTWWLM